MERLEQNSRVPIRVVDRRKAYIPTKDFDMNADAVGTSWLQLARAALHIG
jgi:transcription-repair coupling factor (superfamily II helicase)